MEVGTTPNVIGIGDIYSSTSAANAGPERARLDQAAGGGDLGAWIDADGIAPNWIAVDLRGRPVITGIITQGRQDAPMWTTEYQVYYSQDAVGTPTNWNPVLDANDNPAVFTGNSNQNTKVTQTFFEPVVALHIAIVPTEWDRDATDASTMDLPALRFELLGCPVPQCDEPISVSYPSNPPPRLGVADDIRSILNSQISQSFGTASNGRLDGSSRWVGDTLGASVEVFLGGRSTVTGVEIQGNGIAGLVAAHVWVTAFEVDYSQDNGATWISVKNNPTTGGATTEPFNTGAIASTPENVIYNAAFDQPVSATHIRIRATGTVDGTSTTGVPPEMRFEINGCRDPEITRIAVDGTCAARKVYWIEFGRQSIFYSDLEATNPTTGSLLSVSSGTIVDIELDIDNDLIYFAQQDGTSSLIKRARLSTGSVLNTVTVSTANRNIQSISIDWDTERVYYSINADASGSGVIGYVNLDLSGNTLISTITGNTAWTFYPFDIGVYGDYVYALENKASIIRVMKSLSGSTTATTNVRETVVTNAETFNRLAVDLQFVKCIDFPTVTFDPDTYSRFEYDSIVDVKLTRAGDLRCCSVVNLAIGEDTASLLAKDPEDFSLLANTHVNTNSSTITFQAGEESITLQFKIEQDNTVTETIGEGDEKFSLTLTTNDCAALGTTPSSEVTIKDYYSCYFIDEQDDSYEILEGDTNREQLFPVMRRGYLGQAGTTNFVLIGGSAKIYEDYYYSSATRRRRSSANAEITFSANSETAFVPVTIVGDNDVEDLENFCVQLSVTTGAVNTYLCPGENHKASINITDNDFRVFLRETHITISEDAGTVLVPVCREGYLGDGSVTVPVTLIDTSAIAGMDYVNRIGYQVTFQANQECTNAEITLINDGIGEPNEAFRVVISKPSKGELSEGNTQTYIGITDDDIAIRIQLSAYNVNEGAGSLYITLLRQGALEDDKKVYLVAINGTALSGVDFEDIGEVLFDIGDRSKRFPITIIDDQLFESSETFTVALINEAGQVLSSATVTIEDNDVQPPATQQRYFFDRSSLVVDEYAGNLPVAVIRTRTEEPGSVKSLLHQERQLRVRTSLPLLFLTPDLSFSLERSRSGNSDHSDK
ncbi:uncharacterized protein [Amphiura filiformis]|uniref:uncharacterized protein n=1 Tax=Amphiura filiformis TaxID=82378 RepID=UPI003B210706